MTRVLVAALFCSALASAQNPLMQAYLARYNTMKQNLIEAAEAMPADLYSYRLTPAQRAFGEWIDHTILLMHTSCAQMKGGAPAAMDHSQHGGDKPKVVLVKALREAAEGCDAVLQGMTDAQALDAGGKPVGSMLGLLTNMASHYGNVVGYLRTKGITPPSTARAQKK